MRYYFAPMEGITGYVFRNAHHACFSGVDRYYTPFLAPGASHRLTAREQKDILPEHNQGIALVPQVLTRRAEDFLWACQELYEYGYEEVNLNLGCPSGTVTAKGKGAGLLADPQLLNQFFDQVFTELSASCPGVRVSVKTRIGMESETEFPGLLDIYNQYPICELIIHPRVRSDFYEGRPRMQAFRQAADRSRNPVCYNGDIRFGEDVKRLQREFPELPAVMIGRGAAASPWLMEQLAGLEKGNTEDERRKKLLAFHDRLLDGYQAQMSGERNVLFKMKELWFYLGIHFPDGKKELKRIKKAQKTAEYQSAVRALLEGARFSAEV